MSSSVHVNNKNKYILVYREGPTQGLDEITTTTEVKYSVNFIQLGKIAGSVHYDGSNSFLFVNAVKMYQITAKASEIKPYPLGSGDILKGFTIDNMKKTRLRESAQFFSVDL